MKKKLWGGRFKKDIDGLLKDFSYSLSSDKELLFSELEVNQAYVKMLAKAGFVSVSEKKRLLSALKGIAKEADLKKMDAQASKFEDIHAYLQAQLEKKCGAAGKKIHTARSRNDLVVTSTLVYLRKKVDEIEKDLSGLQKALIQQADKGAEITLPGLTHLRKAQPIVLGHHLLAYVEMLQDDKERLLDVKKRLDKLPLGSAALAGSSLNLDRTFLAKELGFKKISTNSLASVSDRAFLVEFMSALSLIWMHLSRLSEDFILWNSEFFDYVELDDAFATGSSLMPQKKNPDVFELVRGKSAGVFGRLQALLVLQKGLPLSYNRDLQEDKPAVFCTIYETLGALKLVAATIKTSKFHKASMNKQLLDDGLYATDILEYLVRKGVLFSDAHFCVGQLVAYSAETGKALRSLDLKEFKQFSKKIGKDIFHVFDPMTSVRSKKTLGSSNPSYVKKEISRWKRILK